MSKLKEDKEEGQTKTMCEVEESDDQKQFNED